MSTYPPRDPTAVLGRRVVAYLIDFVIFAAVIVVLLAVTTSHRYSNAGDISDPCYQLRNNYNVHGPCINFNSHVYVWNGGTWALAWLGGFVAGLANIAVLQGITGASIGKMITGLRVVDGQGKVAGVGRALLRSLFFVVDNFACYLVGLLTASLTHPHRRVGDMIAGTYVVASTDVGVPIAVTPVAAAGWAPQPMGWGQQPPQPAGWGAPPPAPASPAWGASPAPQPQPSPPPAWGAPPPAPPAPPSPEPQAPPSWAPPPPPPPPPAPAAPPSWGTPPSPEGASGWAPPPAPPAPPVPPATQPAPPSWGAPPPAAPPAQPPAPEPPAPEQPASGESWWNKAVEEDDPPSNQ